MTIRQWGVVCASTLSMAAGRQWARLWVTVSTHTTGGSSATLVPSFARVEVPLIASSMPSGPRERPDQGGDGVCRASSRSVTVTRRSPSKYSSR
jgi:hypothetical protein